MTFMCLRLTMTRSYKRRRAMSFEARKLYQLWWRRRTRTVVISDYECPIERAPRWNIHCGWNQPELELRVGERQASTDSSICKCSHGKSASRILGNVSLTNCEAPFQVISKSSTLRHNFIRRRRGWIYGNGAKELNHKSINTEKRFRKCLFFLLV